MTMQAWIPGFGTEVWEIFMQGELQTSANALSVGPAIAGTFSVRGLHDMCLL